MGTAVRDRAKRLFHAAVGKTFERNDDEASRWGKNLGCGGESTIEGLELVIYGKTKRLKRLREMTRMGEAGAFERGDEIMGGFETVCVARGHDFAGDPARPRQLTVLPQQIRQLALLDGGEKLTRASWRVAIERHL